MAKRRRPKIEKIGNMAPQKPVKGTVRASDFFAARRAADDLAELQKQGFAEMGKATGQTAAQMAHEIVMELTEGLAERGVLPGHKDYAPMLQEFSGGMSDVLENEVRPEDMKHLEVLRQTVEMLDKLSKRAESNRNWRSTKQGQAEEKKIATTKAETAKKEAVNIKDEKALVAAEVSTPAQQHNIQGAPVQLPQIDSEDPDQTIKPRAELIEREEKLEDRKERNQRKAAEVLGEEETLAEKMENAQSLREHLIDLEERQRKIFADSVAGAEIQSRVMFERSNDALEELLKYNKENTETISEFSNNEQRILEELKDLLKEARVSGIGDVKDLKERFANIKGQAAVYGENNSTFERTTKEVTKIIEKAVSKPSLLSRASEGFKGFAREQLSDLGSNLYHKMPLPMRLMVGATTSMIPFGKSLFGSDRSQTKLERANFGRGQMDAIAKLSKEIESGVERPSRGERIISALGGSSRSGTARIIGTKDSKNLNIASMKVGNLTIDMLNVKELDDESDLYKLLTSKGSGGGGLFSGEGGGIIGNVLGALGLGKLLSKGKGIIQGIAGAAKGLFSLGAKGAAGVATAGKFISKLPGIGKLIGGGLLGAGALAGESLLPVAETAKTVSAGEKAVAMTKGAFMTQKALEMAKANPIKGPGGELVKRAEAFKSLEKAIEAAKASDAVVDAGKGAATAAEVAKAGTIGKAATIAAAAKPASMLSKIGNVAGKTAGAIEVGTAAYDLYDVMSGGTSMEDWQKSNKEMDWLDYLSPWKVGKKVGAEAGSVIDKGLSAVEDKDTSLGSKLYDWFSGSKEADITKVVPVAAALKHYNSGVDMGPPSSLAPRRAEGKITAPAGILPPAALAAEERSNSVLSESKAQGGKQANVTINNNNTVVNGGAGGGKKGLDAPIPISPARSQENAFQRYQLKMFAPF